MQEIRTVVAMVCPEMVHVKKWAGATSKKQVDMMVKVFHGTEGHTSVLDELPLGKGAHTGLFTHKC